jgi:hypothetical protein
VCYGAKLENGGAEPFVATSAGIQAMKQVRYVIVALCVFLFSEPDIFNGFLELNFMLFSFYIHYCRIITFLAESRYFALHGTWG